MKTLLVFLIALTACSQEPGSMPPEFVRMREADLAIGLIGGRDLGVFAVGSDRRRLVASGVLVESPVGFIAGRFSEDGNSYVGINQRFGSLEPSTVVVLAGARAVVRQTTLPAVSISRVALTNDRRWLAWEGVSLQTRQRGIWCTDLETGDTIEVPIELLAANKPQELTPYQSFESTLSWRADGIVLAVDSRAGTWLFDRVKGTARLLIRGWYPTWSAEGRELAYLVGSDVFIRNVETGRTVRIFAGTPMRGPIRWSPDGSLIFGVSGPNSPGAAWLIQAVGSAKPVTVFIPERIGSEPLQWFKRSRFQNP